MNINKISEINNQKGYESEVREMTKGSAVKKGIQIGTGSIGVVTYPDLFEGTDEEIAEKIIEIYSSNAVPDFDLDAMTDLEYIKSHMFVAARRPVNDGAFTKDYLDIQLVIRVNISAGDNGTATYIVSQGIAEKLDIKEDIFDEAIKKMEFEFKPMGAMLGLEDDCLLAEDIKDCGMFVISTKEKMYGAAALYDKLFIKSVAELLNSDLLILPSSTQEIIVTRYDENSMKLADMDAMVVEVNTTQVMPEEQLADHVYVYKKDSGTITW